MAVRTLHRALGALLPALLALGVFAAAPAGAHHSQPTPVPAGPRSGLSPVHPPPGSPIDDITRDCGFSVELRDGSALWIFCDSNDFANAHTFFKNNTAAIARPDSPTTMREPLTTSGEPYTFIRPTAYNPCGNDPHIIWPTSAVVVPAGPVDRVLIYFENGCLVGPNNIDGVQIVGIGLAEYVYDPAKDPLAQPIRATVINPSLWSDARQFGRAAVQGEGRIFVYQCDYKWGDPWGCRVGRVAAHVPQDPGMYEYWNGTTWVAGKQNAVFMTFENYDSPGVAYQVTWLEEYGVYAMTYIGWPGVGSTQKVRFATSPTGPWSPAMTLQLSNCDAGSYCYAAGIHTQLTQGADLGLSYFDPLVDFAHRPDDGQVQSYTQPIWVSPPGPHRFVDVLPGHTFFTEIEWMGDAGLSDGWPDGTFRPILPVTREGFAAFLHRASGAPPGPFPDPGFTDVAPTHPFHTEIAWMVATGLTDGFSDGTFRPGGSLAREALAAFLHRAAGAPPGPFPDPGFTDVPPTHPFYTEIAWMVATGLADGFPDGTFRPGLTVTRQETAAFLARWAGP